MGVLHQLEQRMVATKFELSPEASQESGATGSSPAIGFSPREVSVNDVPIPERKILEEAQNHPAQSPGRALHAAAEALVIHELLRQEALRLDIAATPEKDDAGRLETETDAAIRALIDQEVEAPVATRRECLNYYEKHPDKFRTPTLFEARHILIAVPESDVAGRRKARTRAENLCKMLGEKPELFADMALEHSDCPSRDQGGNLGQLSPGSTVAEFETALAGMQEGDIGPSPVESRFGLHVIALDRRIDGRSLPFDVVNGRIAAWLEASAWSKAVSQYISILAGQADITGITLRGARNPLVQ